MTRRGWLVAGIAAALAVALVGVVVGWYAGKATAVVATGIGVYGAASARRDRAQREAALDRAAERAESEQAAAQSRDIAGLSSVEARASDVYEAERGAPVEAEQPCSSVLGNCNE